MNRPPKAFYGFFPPHFNGRQFTLNRFEHGHSTCLNVIEHLKAERLTSSELLGKEYYRIPISDRTVKITEDLHCRNKLPQGQLAMSQQTLEPCPIPWYEDAMSLKARIVSDVNQALKAGDRTKVSVLRMVKAKILEKEVELRSSKGRDYSLNDEETTSAITTYAKQRRQSIDSYRQAEREDLAAQEEKELEILQEYLPKQLSENEIETLVEEAIKEAGASNPGDMGNVMRVLMPRLKGAADGKLVNSIVRKKLSGS